MTAEPPKPKKSDRRQRTETLFARVTPEEKSAFITRADRAGMATATDAPAHRAPPPAFALPRPSVPQATGDAVISRLIHRILCGEYPCPLRRITAIIAA